MSRPMWVRDYQRAEGITHCYDQAVAPERLQTVTCLPVVVPDGPRAILYLGTRTDVVLGDRTLDLLRAVAHRLAVDLRVEQEVCRRVQALIEPVAPPCVGADAALLADIRSDLAQLASAVTEPSTRGRLEAVVATLGRVTGSGLAVRAPSTGLPNPAELTGREVDVLALAEAGLGNAAIAESLGLRPNTVKAYMQSAMNQLGARNRVQATLAARHAGLLDRGVVASGRDLLSEVPRSRDRGDPRSH
jgi:DNA-binding CsgD family transcriptional regulator